MSCYYVQICIVVITSKIKHMHVDFIVDRSAMFLRRRLAIRNPNTHLLYFYIQRKIGLLGGRDGGTGKVR
jgi:hypothetical protein